MTALAKLDKARQMLAESRTLPEIKKIRDIAEAAKVYAKAAHLGHEAQNYAAEISLLAARKAGEILKQLERSPGGEPAKKRHSTPAMLAAVESEYSKALKESGTSERTAQYWQRLAAVPATTYEKHVRETEEIKGEITAAGLLKAHNKTIPVKYPKPKEQAPEWGEELNNALEHAQFCIKDIQGLGTLDQQHKVRKKLEYVIDCARTLIEKLDKAAQVSIAAGLMPLPSAKGKP